MRLQPRREAMTFSARSLERTAQSFWPRSSTARVSARSLARRVDTLAGVAAAAPRVVILDHYFGQDIAALRETAGRAVEWRVVPYFRFRDAANRIFPESVQHGLAPYSAPVLAEVRARYARRLRREVGRLYREWPFDVFVLPSDTFYYVRELRPICHALGVPVIVVQKETTITDETFERHAPDVGAHAPFVADRMTVCSERHKSFWVRAGADPELIEVTGQPRFDAYSSDRPRPTWTGVGLDEAPRTVLFLSYQIDAYLHAGPTEPAELDWGSLRAQTEAALYEAVQHGWRVVVKLHPQQPYDDEARRLRAAAPRCGQDVVLAQPDADTRLLLLLADAVVGFQSTALLEALALPKPVAYAGWGGLHDAMAAGLIPFGSLAGLMKLASSGDDLSSWLSSVPVPPDEETVAQRRALVEAYLGPFDGLASERTLAVIARLAGEWSAKREESPWRRRLDRLVLPSALGSLGRGAAQLPALRALGAAGRAVGWGRVVAGADVRRATVGERLLRARQAVRDGYPRGSARRAQRMPPTSA